MLGNNSRAQTKPPASVTNFGDAKKIAVVGHSASGKTALVHRYVSQVKLVANR
jgi:GTPase SAR1 family protein